MRFFAKYQMELMFACAGFSIFCGFTSSVYLAWLNFMLAGFNLNYAIRLLIEKRCRKGLDARTQVTLKLVAEKIAADIGAQTGMKIKAIGDPRMN